MILPIWVFYLLKDKASLVGSFDRALPAVLAVRRLGDHPTVERVFGQWVRGQLILGFTVGVFTFIGLMVLS